MAIDPPYRFDPLQNPVNVKWEGLPNFLIFLFDGEGGPIWDFISDNIQFIVDNYPLSFVHPGNLGDYILNEGPGAFSTRSAAMEAAATNSAELTDTNPQFLGSFAFLAGNFGSTFASWKMPPLGHGLYAGQFVIATYLVDDS